MALDHSTAIPHGVGCPLINCCVSVMPVEVMVGKKQRRMKKGRMAEEMSGLKREADTERKDGKTKTTWSRLKNIRRMDVVDV